MLSKIKHFISGLSLIFSAIVLLTIVVCTIYNGIVYGVFAVRIRFDVYNEHYVELPLLILSIVVIFKYACIEIKKAVQCVT